jgi:hypothetical protein
MLSLLDADPSFHNFEVERERERVTKTVQKEGCSITLKPIYRGVQE